MLNYVTDSAFTYRMLQVIRDEDGLPHIVETDSNIPVNTTVSIVTFLQSLCTCELACDIASKLYKRLKEVSCISIFE